MARSTGLKIRCTKERAGPTPAALTFALEENLGAAAIQLTPTDLQDIDRAASRIEVHGSRYPGHLQKMV